MSTVLLDFFLAIYFLKFSEYVTLIFDLHNFSASYFVVSDGFYSVINDYNTRTLHRLIHTVWKAKYISKINNISNNIFVTKLFS